MRVHAHRRVLTTLPGPPYVALLPPWAACQGALGLVVRARRARWRPDAPAAGGDSTANGANVVHRPGGGPPTPGLGPVAAGCLTPSPCAANCSRRLARGRSRRAQQGAPPRGRLAGSAHAIRSVRTVASALGACLLRLCWSRSRCCMFFPHQCALPAGTLPIAPIGCRPHRGFQSRDQQAPARHRQGRGRDHIAGAARPMHTAQAPRRRVDHGPKTYASRPRRRSCGVASPRTRGKALRTRAGAARFVGKRGSTAVVPLSSPWEPRCLSMWHAVSWLGISMQPSGCW
jgi:hypothetical protein